MVCEPWVDSRAAIDEAVAPPSPPAPYSLYTQTYGGRIGIVHGLTKQECETQRFQALGQPSTKEEKAATGVFAVDGFASTMSADGWDVPVGQ